MVRLPLPTALVGRIQDLAELCYHRDVPSHTEFLTLAEQDLFYRTVNKIPGVRYVLSGGYEAAERKAALFLPSYAEDGDASMLPIAVVRISPLNEKFADALSHRDFLGSLMNLGDRKSTRLNSSHMPKSRMPSSA